MSTVPGQRQLSNNEVTEVVADVSTLNAPLATSNMNFLPAEIIEIILKFLDRKNKEKLRLVNERYLIIFISL